MADHVVGVGPKLNEAFRSNLCGCSKDGNVFDLTPGVFEESETVKPVSSSNSQQCRVLIFGRGDVEDFKLKGFDIAGKVFAALEDTRLVFVGAPDRKHEEIANRLIECGVPASRLISRSGSCSHAFENRGLWINRTRGNVSWVSLCSSVVTGIAQCSFWFNINICNWVRGPRGVDRSHPEYLVWGQEMSTWGSGDFAWFLWQEIQLGQTDKRVSLPDDQPGSW